MNLSRKNPVRWVTVRETHIEHVTLSCTDERPWHASFKSPKLELVGVVNWSDLQQRAHLHN